MKKPEKEGRVEEDKVMKNVVKVIMYTYRENNGKKEFFVLHRKRGDCVVLTGHVRDREEIKNESLEDAARRETIEELGVEPMNIIDLKTKIYVEIEKNNAAGYEHAFLIQIPNKDVHFLEGDEKHNWHSLEELDAILTYPNQRESLNKIKLS
ncbi:NUDIX domain-containing protein [Candidatus Parcubacteria bacterium]|nr:NUDIX domain-containing protein [Candidatus Parcubacteria bacterium]